MIVSINLQHGMRKQADTIMGEGLLLLCCPTYFCIPQALSAGSQRSASDTFGVRSSGSKTVQCSQELAHLEVVRSIDIHTSMFWHFDGEHLASKAALVPKNHINL